jgi:(2Fe-2S) ferredoxin
MGTCGLASGADKIKKAIEEELAKKNLKAEIIPTGCIGLCAKEVIVDVKLPDGERISYCEVTTKDVPQLIHKTIVEQDIYKEKLLGTHGEGKSGVKRIKDITFFRKQKRIVLENCGIINPDSIDEYIAYGGFKGLDKALRLMTSKDVVNEVLESGLRGRGGGGFPTGKKWEMIHNKKADQKYLICNADEGDPGAFMDRSILESDPFRLIEGMIIASYAVGANNAYIYCRAEYPLAKDWNTQFKNAKSTGYSVKIYWVPVSISKLKLRREQALLSVAKKLHLLLRSKAKEECRNRDHPIQQMPVCGVNQRS